MASDNQAGAPRIGHFTAHNLADTGLYACIKTLNYLFMLLAMTYNFWVIFFMALGLALADFCAGYRNDLKYITQRMQSIKNQGNP